MSTWSVHRDGSQIITWTGQVLSLADDAEDENGSPVGEMYAYLAPLALDRESTYDDFDAISADLDMVAVSLCHGSAALDWDLVQKYGNPNATGGLLIIDHFTLVPVARKRGALPLVLRELLYTMPASTSLPAIRTRSAAPTRASVTGRSASPGTGRPTASPRCPMGPACMSPTPTRCGT